MPCTFSKLSFHPTFKKDEVRCLHSSSIAGGCYIELYREAVSQDKPEAEEYGNKAESFLAKVAAYIGRKKFMAKSLPLETYCDRKVKKWKRFAAARNCKLVEVIGVSPLEDMIYMWSMLQLYYDLRNVR